MGVGFTSRMTDAVSDRIPSPSFTTQVLSERYS
jgi:hypothetical protein